MSNFFAVSAYLIFSAVAAKHVYDLGKMRGFELAHDELDAKREEVYATLDRLKRLEEARREENGN